MNDGLIEFIQTSDGQCLSVDPTSGDFRENLTPVQIKPCNGSDGQKWDVITVGKHNDQPGFALIVSSQVANSRTLIDAFDHSLIDFVDQRLPQLRP